MCLGLGFCVGLYFDGIVVMIGKYFGLVFQFKEFVLECKLVDCFFFQESFVIKVS